MHPPQLKFCWGCACQQPRFEFDTAPSSAVCAEILVMFLVVNADRLLLLLRPARRKFLIPFQSFGAITAFPRNFGTDGGSDNQVEVKWRQLVARLASPKLKRCLIARVKVARDRNRQYCVGEQCHFCLRPVEANGGPSSLIQSRYPQRRHGAQRS